VSKDQTSVTIITGRPTEVFLVFLRLGCTSFGGPVAHLGYFRTEFVERRRWCSEQTFAELVALANSLPGPASSQVGFAVGLLRAGWPGGVAAWLGFTMPSALLMFALAIGNNLSGKTSFVLLHGLQLVAVAVVARAVLAMQRSLAPDARRFAIAMAAMLAVLFVPVTLINLCVILLAGLLGVGLFRDRAPAVRQDSTPMSPLSALVPAVALSILLLVALAALRIHSAPLAVFSAFYRTGALVFGGGHVVLPLLERGVVSRGWVSQDAFLTGYGLVQAVPGPLFSFATYLGALIPQSGELTVLVAYALLATVGLFLPGLLAMAALLPLSQRLLGNRLLHAALLGVNASVVGILAAALVRPLWASTMRAPVDYEVVVAVFVLLGLKYVQPWMVVIGVAAGSWLWHLAGSLR
jgi:chromate transporter